MHQFLFCVQRLSAKLLWPRPSGIRDGNSSSRGCSSYCLAKVLGHWNAIEELYKPVTVYFTRIKCHCTRETDAATCWIDWFCLNILHRYSVHLTSRVKLSLEIWIVLVTGDMAFRAQKKKKTLYFLLFLAVLVDLSSSKSYGLWWWPDFSSTAAGHICH